MPTRKMRAKEEPVAMLREAARLLRRCAIVEPKYLPIAEKIEGIADKQAEYEKVPPETIVKGMSR